MRLSQVIAGAGVAGDLGTDPGVSLVTGDSRAVRPGAAFFALPGSRADGHDFAAAAARAGAVAVVAERRVECAPALLLLAAASRRAMAIAAANYHGRPGDRLALAGVTGTKGKTTVTYLVEACARAADLPIGIAGTISNRYPGVSTPSPLTTLESTDLQELLAKMVAAGARLAVLEVSSHALAQDRVAGLRFGAAAFTNLSRDHFDFHGDFDAYFAAKRRLFLEHLAPAGIAVVNARDPWGARLADQIGPGRTVWRVGERSEDSVRIERVCTGIDGIEALLKTPTGDVPVRSPLVGAHNLENLLTAAGLALALGIPREAVAAGLSNCRGAPGRLERFEAWGVTVFVDYAHTDDALARTCAALRQLSPRRLLVVFGCGGDRDPGKRPLMGRAAGQAGDLVVVTSDNPRTEDPLTIIQAIVPGLEEAGLHCVDEDAAGRGERGFVVLPDRREAIDLAIRAARPGDAVLIAGKGHERYQILGAERRPFDDREEARRALGTA